MDRVKETAVLMALLLFTGGPAAIAERSAETAKNPSPEATELPSSIKEPRLFPFGDTWLMSTAKATGKDGPFGLSPCAFDLYQVGEGAEYTPRRPEIVVPAVGSVPPPYALKPELDVVTVVYGAQTSATMLMYFDQVSFEKSVKTTKVKLMKHARMFKAGQELSYMDSRCPIPLSFVRGSPDEKHVALCGKMGNRVAILVRSGSTTEPSRWNVIDKISPRAAASPRGVWLTKDKIMVGWIEGRYVKGHVVMVAAVSRPDTPSDGTWKISKPKKVHSGPACRISMVPTKKGVVLGIIELTADASRLVVYEGKDKVDSFKISGAMPVAVEGTPVDFSINKSATKAAAIVSKGPGSIRSVYVMPGLPVEDTLFVQSLKLSPYKPLDEKEMAAIAERLEREDRERAKAEEEARKSAPKTLQERLQQN